MDQAQWENPGRKTWSPALCLISWPLKTNTHKQEVSVRGPAAPMGKSRSSQESLCTAVVGRLFPKVTSIVLVNSLVENFST